MTKFILIILHYFAATPSFAQTTALDSLQTDDGSLGIHYVLRDKFIEGGWEWMTPILLCFLFGMAIVIERIIYLTLSQSNTTQLLNTIETHLQQNDIAAAKLACKNTRGPVASLFQQGFERLPEGIEVVEKTIVAHGSVQTGLLERGLSWISLFISIAPMLGFLGTVVGMVIAFDDIEAAGDISPTIVAHGIKVALITTVAGLIVAIILQVFYNYLLAKIDRMVIDMEDAAIAFVDKLIKYK